MTERSFAVEEVTEAAPVPKAPPLRAVAEAQAQQQAPRQPDYLEGFLNPKPEPAEADDIVAEVVLALRQIHDPEIPVNIYDLGLIYNVEVDNGHAVVTMTLTTPHCPVAESMPGEVEIRVCAVPGIQSCDVNLVWDPAWDPSKMSDEARLEMGML
ncbi:iron-sulfur cluster assembly protein [Sandarakinorhabdus sp.]|uniref:iron-sulfur cluster assembly protein n=1 Tax=Sandarakinorhabdus sp. TaxID=1916663 RepID=UPI003F6FBDDB